MFGVTTISTCTEKYFVLALVRYLSEAKSRAVSNVAVETQHDEDANACDGTVRYATVASLTPSVCFFFSQTVSFRAFSMCAALVETR